MTRFTNSLCAALLLLGACSTGGPVPEDRFYQLESIAPQRMLAQPVISGGLKIEPVSSDPLRAGRALLYRDTKRPLELQRYHYEFWVDQPPRMLHRQLVTYLRKSGVSDFVRDGGSRVSAAYTLRTSLQRFEQLIGDGQSRAEIELQATLLVNASDTVLWSKVYRQQHDSSGPEIHATAAAMQSALAQLMPLLVADIAKLDP